MNPVILKIIVISLMSLFLVPAIPAWAGTDNPDSPAERSWWEHWSRDRSGNGIDDRIDIVPAALFPDEEFAIFVHFDRLPTVKDEDMLRPFGNVFYRSHYINTISMFNVSRTSVEEISTLPHVVMVEKQDIYYPFLDTAIPGVKARPNDVYPHNVWEELEYTGMGINIAILDTGVDDEHESLDGKFVAGFNALPTSGDPGDGSNNPDDRNGHGTHCAGIAMGDGGNTDDDGDGEPDFKGAAPDARLIDVKVLSDAGGTNAAYTQRGIEWCIDNKDEFNINVLSMSFGSLADSGGDDGSSANAQLVNTAVESGLVCVVAAGNDGDEGIPSPGSADRAITVGALVNHDTITRNDDEWASYSNYGPRSDDGDEDQMDELKPEVTAPGSDIRSAQAAPYPYTLATDGYTTMDGTSMACPMVAGIAALLLEADEDLEPSEQDDRLKQILMNTSESKGALYDPDLSEKYNTHYGFGMVDALNATLVASGKKIQEPVEITVTIETPRFGEQVNGTVYVNGTAEISNGSIKKVQFRMDSGRWKKVSGTYYWSYKWNTKIAVDGFHNITVRAISEENESYTGDAITRVYINNTGVEGEKLPSDSDDDGFITEDQGVMLGAAGLIVLVLVGMVYATRSDQRNNPKLYEEEREKKKKKGQEKRKKESGKSSAKDGKVKTAEKVGTTSKKKTPGNRKTAGKDKLSEKVKSTGKKGSKRKGKTALKDAPAGGKGRKAPPKAKKGKAERKKPRPLVIEEVVVEDEAYVVAGAAAHAPGVGCRHCGGALTFIPQYGRKYCYGCGQYD